jgi:hypothetical protein
MINTFQNPKMQQILQNILQSRKQQGGGIGLDSSMPQMQQPQSQPIAQPSFDGNDFKKSVQSISNLMGYGSNTTFGGEQFPQGKVNPIQAISNAAGYDNGSIFGHQMPSPGGVSPGASSPAQSAPLSLMQSLWGMI